MTLLSAVFGALTALTCIYRLLTVYAAAKYAGARGWAGAYSEPATVLKPLCGSDYGLRENLISVLKQDCAAYRTVFCAADADDPALTAAREASAASPEADVAFAAGGAPICPNRKVANLIQAEPHLTGSVVVISDSDIRVTSDWLTRILAPFARKEVGGVTCPYRLTEAFGLAATMEALHVGADFIPSVLLAWAFAPSAFHFGFGSTLAVRRSVLDACGGFRSLCGEIADDARLAECVRRQGLRMELSEVIVECPVGRVRWDESVARRVRWARTIRSLQPLGYVGALLTHSIPLALAWALTCRTPLSAWALGATLMIRIGAACIIARRFTRDRCVTANLWLLPIADLLSALIWAAGLMGRRVRWRGHELGVSQPTWDHSGRAAHPK